MSKAGVVFDLATEEIKWLVRVSKDSDLALNFDPTTQGLIELLPDHSIFSEQFKWRIEIIAGQARLEQTDRVIITPDRFSFNADGIDEVTIQFQFVAPSATINLGGGLTAPVPPDGTLILTSDVPRVFVVQVQDRFHWSRPVRIEAVAI